MIGVVVIGQDIRIDEHIKDLIVGTENRFKAKIIFVKLKPYQEMNLYSRISEFVLIDMFDELTNVFGGFL